MKRMHRTQPKRQPRRQRQRRPNQPARRNDNPDIEKILLPHAALSMGALTPSVEKYFRITDNFYLSTLSVRIGRSLPLPLPVFLVVIPAGDLLLACSCDSALPCDQHLFQPYRL
jgi:hypothetical protein